MDRTCSTYEAIPKCIQSFSGKTWRKETLREAESRWEDNIKMDLREVEFDAGDRIDLAQTRVEWRAYARAVMKFRVP